ncbi:unnamed protein product [Ceutorhynchus assimilis]|uniref:GPI inositol-deacylase n=1 Tax=Ceutorhynchus assimilis TaxID=467358 RepID=A0A9N9N3I1_9CUCU|nr:unnamed protein product [Ceutorhynchus assimilis]
MKKIIIYLLTCLLVFLLYLTGLVFFLTDHEPGDKCEMTYMFEYPQYVRVSQDVDLKYPKYGLYAYGEGRMTKKARNMYFDGVPVLFIPGNAGSHQQVRSLSSIALRKALNSGTPFHLDYFTVDLNSEFSALYGPVLYDQLQYVLSSVHKILELYKHNRNPPKQVILVGHSVGGIVAKKTIAELLSQNKKLVSVLIMLATPLANLPIYFDRHGSNFYSTSSFEDDSIVSVSITGGYSDLLVPSYLAVNKGNNTIIVVSTNIAKSWVESNHVQILWCKQTVLAINRALFDSVDRLTLQISTDPKFVKRVFEYHLIHNSGSKIHLSNTDLTIPARIDYKGEWIESLYRQYSVEHKRGIKQPHWYMVSITNQPTYEMLTVLAINLEVTDWAFVCNAAYPNKAHKVCVEAQHLTQFSEIFPSSRHKRRLLTINMHEIRTHNKEYTHVVFRALPTSEPLTFHVDTYGSYEREIEVSLPIFSVKKQVLVPQTPDKALIYSLVIPELNDPLQIYQLFVEPISCRSKTHHATASVLVPWANESIHVHFTELSNKPLILRVQNPKHMNGGNVKVRLILEPMCTYRISIRLHILGIFGQIARYYSPFLFATSVIVFLLAFQSQIHLMGDTGKVPIFFSALFHGTRQIWIVVLTFLASVALNNFIPNPEYRIFSNSIYLGFALAVLFMVSYVAVLILVAAYCVSLFTLESTVHKLTLKLLARTVTFTIKFSDYFMTFLQKVPFMVATVLVVLSFSTCGGLALGVGLVFYFLKLTQMSQDYVEQIAWFVVKIIARKIRRALSRNKKEETTSKNEEIPAIKDIDCKENIESSSDNEKEKSTNKEVLDVKGNTDDCKDSNGTEEVIESIENSVISESNETEEQLPEALENLGDQISTHTNAPEADKEKTENTEEEKNPFENLTETNNAIFFHSSLFFIWVIVTILNSPAVITWAHNFRYSKHLTPDDSLIPGLVFSIGGFVLWQFDLPRTDRKWTNLLRLVSLCMIPVTLLYATVSIYRINYMLTILFALVLLQQMLAPKLEGEFEDDKKDEANNKFDEMKMKID